MRAVCSKWQTHAKHGVRNLKGEDHVENWRWYGKIFYLKNAVGRSRLDSFSWGQETVAGACENDKKLMDSTKREDHLL